MAKLRIVSHSDEPFRDRQEAGQLLGRELNSLHGQRAVVLGIPRGGIIVARELARALEADLDIVLSHKLRTPGAHGAYTHFSPSATKIAARLITDLEALGKIQVSPPENVNRAISQAAKAIDKAMGKGAANITQKVTVNIGTIHGGLKVNMIPGDCVIELDIRLPIGLDKARIMEEVEKIVARYPEVSVGELNYNPPSWCDPYGEMVRYLQANVKTLKGFEPLPVVSLGGTDCRLWRYRDIPAYVYGPYPTGMGSFNEYIDIEEFLYIVRTHVLSAYDYLCHD